MGELARHLVLRVGVMSMSAAFSVLVSMVVLLGHSEHSREVEVGRGGGAQHAPVQVVPTKALSHAGRPRANMPALPSLAPRRVPAANLREAGAAIRIRGQVVCVLQRLGGNF